MKRRQLGVYSKSPVDKVKDSILGQFFGITAAAVTFGISWFFLNWGIDMLNFLEDNMEAGGTINPDDPISMIVKSVIAGAAALFVLSRKI